MELTSKKENWWTRPGGGMEVLVLAVPMIISSGSIALMQITDRIFLTWYDTYAMGAAFSASNFLWLLVAFPFSIASYANAFVSQYNGARQYGQIGPIIWQGILLGLIAMPIFLLLSPWLHYLFEAFDHEAKLAHLESVYLYYLLWGTGPMIATEAVVAFFTGRKKMSVVMNVNLMFVAVNIILDYFLIFGFRGHFVWGLAGAAIATTIAQWLRLATFLFLMIYEDRKEHRYRILAGCRFLLKPFTELIKYGGMAGVQFVMEMVGFSTFVMLIAKVGPQENAATAIAINLNTLSFLPVIGAGVAVITLVGNHLGEGRPHLARRATLTALTFATVLTGICVIAFVCFPDLLLNVYARSNPQEFEPLRKMTIILLRFVALYLFFDTINIIFCSAIKGAGDTRFVMITTCIMSFMLVLPVWIGTEYFNGGLYWCWSVASCWTFTLCCIYLTRFVGGRWMKMRLVEPVPVPLNKGELSEGEPS